MLLLIGIVGVLLIIVLFTATHGNAHHYRAVAAPGGQTKDQKLNKDKSAFYANGKWNKIFKVGDTNRKQQSVFTTNGWKPISNNKAASGVASKTTAGATSTTSKSWKPPIRGKGLVNTAWSEYGSKASNNTKTKASKVNVAINTAYDKPKDAAAKVAQLKKNGNYVVSYLNIGRFSKDEHKDMYNEIKSELAGIGKSMGSVYKKSNDQWNEDWLKPKAIQDPRVFNIINKAASNEIARMKNIGIDAVNLDNVDFYQKNNGGTGSTADKQIAIKFAHKLADTAHAKGLAIGWKNGPEIAAAVAPKYDFAVTEQLFDSNISKKWDLPSMVNAFSGKEIYNFQSKRDKPYHGELPSNFFNYNDKAQQGWVAS